MTVWGNILKLLVSDYDDTLYTGDHNIKINVKKIKEFIDKGNLFMLSSGRSYYSLKGKIIEHNIPYSYLGTEDGSHLFDSNDILIHEELLNPNILEELDPILELGKHKGLQYGTTREYYFEDKGLPLSSLNIIIDEDNIDKEFLIEWKKLKKKYNKEYNFLEYGYRKEWYYCIKPVGVEKSKPVDKLKELYNLDNKDIFVIGDGDNDLNMIVNYNGYMIGDNERLKRCALHRYNEVHELIDDIEKNKVLRRW